VATSNDSATPATADHGDATSNTVTAFTDFVTAEQEYFRQTKIFPIMHTVVLRRELYERHPWLARSPYKAFTEALRIAQGLAKKVWTPETIVLTQADDGFRL
jgi:hypothetical protein